MSEKLAFYGGVPVQPYPLESYNPIGQEEKDAVQEVMDSGILSGFVACEDDRFYGGDRVKTLERNFANLFGVNYAVSLNSATSGLMAAVGALELEIGDEVIVPAQTMSATAAAVLAYNAIPVFADVEKDTFGLDPESVEKRISEKTKAIIIVHLYGHPAKMSELMNIAKSRGLKIIEDCAQSPLAMYHKKATGTFGDMGVFSFNIHKHINSGEGGIVITNNKKLFKKICLIRNHGEVKGEADNIVNSIGWNFRMTELQAAIAVEQLKKLRKIVEAKRHWAIALSKELSRFVWIQPPVEMENCRHSFYDFPILFDFKKISLAKKEFMKITEAENLPMTESYKPLYFQDIYQKKVCYGSRGFPFIYLSKKNQNNYAIGSCPVAEELYSESCLTFEVCSYSLKDEHIEKIVNMMHKIEKR